MKIKSDYMVAINAYLAAEPKSGPEAKAAVLEVQKLGSAYYNYAENFVGDSDLLGAHNSDLWAQGFAEDCAEYLASMLDHFSFLAQAFEKLPELAALKATPAPTAYANMQRMVATYLNSDLAKDLRKRFIKSGLPTYGFDNEATPKSKFNIKTILSFSFGIVLVCLILIITLTNPQPSKFQAAVFWAVLAMALAGVASVIPGFVEVRFRKLLVAGGSLAVFVIVYFAVPADVQQGGESAPITIPATPHTSIGTSE
ncbi:MAG: hypothetical protein RR311_00585 [Comamonas sp.]